MTLTWKQIGTAIGAILVFIGGMMANDFVNYRSERREAIRTEYDKAVEAENQLNNLLQRFALIAAGRVAKTDEDIAALRADLLKIQSTADNIVMQVPTVAPQRDELVKRMIALVDAAVAVPEFRTMPPKRQSFSSQRLRILRPLHTNFVRR